MTWLEVSNKIPNGNIWKTMKIHIENKTMTPIEKEANEIVEMFLREIDESRTICETYPNCHCPINCQEKTSLAKQCAILHVKRLLDFMEEEDKQYKVCHYINSPVYRKYELILDYLNNK